MAAKNNAPGSPGRTGRKKTQSLERLAQQWVWVKEGLVQDNLRNAVRECRAGLDVPVRRKRQKVLRVPPLAWTKERFLEEAAGLWDLHTVTEVMES